MKNSPELHACSTCSELLTPTIEASKSYHDLLADLEAAHIRKDSAKAIRISEQVTNALRDRDAALAALTCHRSSHTRA